MNDNHTPAPWRIGNKWNSVVADGFTGYDDEGTIKAYGGHLVCESAKLPANAHLIAAAPDLYEALEEATKWIKWHREHPNTINNNSYLFDNKANAALAKARGE